MDSGLTLGPNPDHTPLQLLLFLPFFLSLHFFLHKVRTIEHDPKEV